MLFALQDVLAALFAFAVWLQFVIGLVLFVFVFFYLMALVVGFMDLILNPKSVFLAVVGAGKGKRKGRSSARRSKRAKPQSSRKPKAQPRPIKRKVPGGTPVEKSADAGGTFVLSHEMRAYFDEYMRERGV